jgi:hypothetical protein
MNKGSGVVRAICVGLSLLAVASCSLLGASLDPLMAEGCSQCGAVCVDLRTNVTSCGACGNACKQGEACVEGQCRVSCPGGQVACDSLCYATSNDPRHCGDCATACKAGEVCGDARCSSTCPAGQTNCDGSCADIQTDAKHCGACGSACGANDECVEGKCLIACKTQLNQPLTDPWGWSWDGLERAASTFTEAANTCTQFRGRLPTASELHRVSATQSATVGQTIHTNPLWSLAPVSPGVHVRLRLSDAAVLSEADATKTNYRCVCPPPLPKVYVANNCYGAPNANACATLDGEGGAHNLDTKDRPPIPKGAAVWECAFYGGHLPTTLQLAEAVQQNIGPGSGNWLHSANEVRYDLGALVNWTDGQNFLFQYTAGTPNSMAWNVPTTPYAFRCIGENAAPPALPPVAEQWAGPGRRRIEAKDLPAGTLIQAVDHCFQSGGHLPTMAELNELVVQGAPGGSGAWLWTSDQTGSDGTNFTVAITKWTGTDTAHLYGGADMTWSYKTESRPYRCVYYPVDAAYLGPPATSCAGGCATVASPGTSGAKSWFDNADRTGATVTAAIDACRKLGGHLPSERDLTEAIRAGLPNGTNAFLQTSDPMLGNCGLTEGACAAVNVLVGVVKWTAAMPTFDDLWENGPNARSTWGWSYEAKPYRCMWTNELR